MGEVKQLAVKLLYYENMTLMIQQYTGSGKIENKSAGIMQHKRTYLVGRQPARYNPSRVEYRLPKKEKN